MLLFLGGIYKFSSMTYDVVKVSFALKRVDGLKCGGGAVPRIPDRLYAKCVCGTVQWCVPCDDTNTDLF